MNERRRISLESVFRYFAGLMIILVSAFLLFAFEYFKLFSLGANPIVYGFASLACFGLGNFLWIPPRRALFWRVLQAGLTAFVVALFYAGFLKWSASRPLPKMVESGSRCESLFLGVFHLPLDRIGLGVNPNFCTFHYLKEKVDELPQAGAEDLLFKAPPLIAEARGLDETNLIELLSVWNNLHQKWAVKEGDVVNAELNRLKSLFELYEGDLTLIEAYRFKSMWDGPLRDPEATRIKKAVEISTLGKMMKTLASKLSSAYLGVSILKERKVLPESAAGELSYLDIRKQKMSERFIQILNRWKLKTELASLSIQDTYPKAYEEISQNLDINTDAWK